MSPMVHKKMVTDYNKLPVEGRFDGVDESLAVIHTLSRFIQYRAVERLFLGGANSGMIEGAYLCICVARAKRSPTTCI